LEYLERAGRIPGPDYGELKLDSDWDPLRGDPRFEKIVASFAPTPSSADHSATLPSAPSPLREKSIAVLPFENRSTDKADAFFADGMQDDVMNSVGKIKDLKVIARASVMQYRGERLAGKVREIGEALRVTHVLEGSVRKVADRVVLNASLIDTRDERQVWTERYERTVTDALSLQGELAVEIARALHATLTPAEKTVAAAKPTENPDAYLLYLRGREADTKSRDSREWEAALELYQHAIALDPNFALARARFAISASTGSLSLDRPDLKAAARIQAAEALRLRPDLGEARLAMTYVYLWLDNDDDRALEELARAAELSPNSAEVPLTEAFIYKRKNKYRERLAALRRAEALDPRSARVLLFLTLTNRWVRDWPEAMRNLDQYGVVARSDDPLQRQWSRACDEFRLTGDIEALKRPIVDAERASPSPEWLNAARYETAMFERDFDAAAGFLAQVSEKGLEKVVLPDLPPHGKAFHEALVAVARGSDATERARALNAARNAMETVLSPASQRSDAFGQANANMDLALIYAFLGLKEEAIRAAQSSLQIHPFQGDTIEKRDLAAGLALVYAQAGESEQAMDLIEHLLTVPVSVQRGAVSNMTLTDLKWRWVWDPLRSNPRFQKIIAGPEPKTVY